MRRFNQWNVDELIYLDITRDNKYQVHRGDHKEMGSQDPMKILSLVAKTCFMPLTWGGQIRSVTDMRNRIQAGADKIALNSAAVATPSLITEGAKVLGSQAVVVSIDVAENDTGIPVVHVDGGQTATALDPAEWAKEAELRGAGEILLQNVDRDGTGQGYDLDLIEQVAQATTIPVIACSGIGRYEQYAEGVKAGASAVAAANIWHFKELSDRAGKKALAKAGIPVRI